MIGGMKRIGIKRLPGIRAVPVVALILTCACTSALAQGHHEATGEQTVTIKPRSTDVKFEGEFEMRKEVRLEYKSDDCEAKLQLEYYQKGASAHVKSTLTNEQCPASSGAYIVQVRYRDEKGDLLTKEFPETWARDDAAPIVMEKDYPVADDVDIVRVRSRGLSCECAATELDDPAPDPDAGS